MGSPSAVNLLPFPCPEGASARQGTHPPLLETASQRAAMHTYSWVWEVGRIGRTPIHGGGTVDEDRFDEHARGGERIRGSLAARRVEALHEILPDLPCVVARW
jgi:hypothetical protein